MNDFTKEELIEILEYCNWPPGSVGFSDFRVNLWIKIDSMIDNYCEHLWTDGSGNNIFCAKCHTHGGKR